MSGEGPAAIEAFDGAEMLGWMAAQGLADSVMPVSARLPMAEGPLILKAGAPCSVWLISSMDADRLTCGDAPGPVMISIRRAVTTGVLLPPPLGRLRDEFTICRGTARAYDLKPGEVGQVIDVEGQQCSDFIAFRADGLNANRVEMIDNTATRTMVRRSFPGPVLFDKFHDSEMRPLLNVVQDTCGRHDTFCLACTGRGYEERGFPGHINSSDNISDVLDPYGVPRRNAWPAVNFFWNTWVEAGSGHGTHHLQTEESWSRPGDYVAMRAMEPLLCVSTACPDDIDPINGRNPTDIHVRIYQPDAPIRRAVANREKEPPP